MNLTEKKNQLLALMRRPQTKRKPTNFALWWAWLFYNLVAFFLDAITSWTVFTLTNILYAVLTFFAGFMPLLMHEFLFMRAYASKFQRGLAIFGAGVSVVAIVVIGLLAGGVNVIGIGGMENGLYMELSVISLIVLISAFHGLLAAVYFYADEGIRAKHNQAEAVAYHDQQLENINLALDLAAKVEQAAVKEDEFISKFGDRELLDEAMSQITGAIATAPAQARPQDAPQAQARPQEAAQLTQDAPEAEIIPVPLAQGTWEDGTPRYHPVPNGFSGNGNGHK